MTRLEPRLTPDATADVLAAARHYESLREGFGAKFLDELENALSLIQATPLLFTVVDEPIRRFLLRRFPDGVFYEPGESQDTVLAVMDLRQDPEAIRRAYSR